MNKRIFIKTPLRTPGGKSKALPKLLEHITTFEEYRENFLGGGSMFLRLAQLYPDKIYWINDLQYATYAVWNTIYNNSEQMIQFILEQKNKYKNENEGRMLHTYCRKEIDIVDKKDEFLTACYLYILNKTSFSGLSRIGSYAPQAFTSNFTIKCINNLKNVSNIMHSVKSLKITNLDYSKLLVNDENTFIFCDPPYNIKHNLYGNDGDMHRGFNHKKFSDDIKNCKSKWMITYNDNPTIKEWFSEYQCIPWNLQYTMQSAKRTSHGNLVSEREKISGKEITTFQQVKSKNAKSDKSGKIGQELLILNY